MPNIKQSQIDSSKLPEIAPSGSNPSSDESTVTGQAASNPSAFMLSSMPAMAAQSDLLQRQFHGGVLPTQRILPATRRTNR